MFDIQWGRLARFYAEDDPCIKESLPLPNIVCHFEWCRSAAAAIILVTERSVRGFD